MHMELLVNTFERYYGQEATESAPEGMDDLFTLDWMRQQLAGVVDKAKGHLSKVR